MEFGVFVYALILSGCLVLSAYGGQPPASLDLQERPRAQVSSVGECDLKSATMWICVPAAVTEAVAMADPAAIAERPVWPMNDINIGAQKKIIAGEA